MLTPSATDPNRKSELARRKKDPFSFGSDININRPKDFTESGELVVEKPKKKSRRTKK